jgi:hypothetical protein
LSSVLRFWFYVSSDKGRLLYYCYVSIKYEIVNWFLVWCHFSTFVSLMFLILQRKNKMLATALTIFFVNLHHTHLSTARKDIFVLITLLSQWTEIALRSHFGKYNSVWVSCDMQQLCWTLIMSYVLLLFSNLAAAHYCRCNELFNPTIPNNNSSVWRG